MYSLVSYQGTFICPASINYNAFAGAVHLDLPSETEQVNRRPHLSSSDHDRQFSLEATNRLAVPLVCCPYKDPLSCHHAATERVWGGGRASCVTSKTPKAQQW